MVDVNNALALVQTLASHADRSLLEQIWAEFVDPEVRDKAYSSKYFQALTHGALITRPVPDDVIKGCEILLSYCQHAADTERFGSTSSASAHGVFALIFLIDAKWENELEGAVVTALAICLSAVSKIGANEIGCWQAVLQDMRNAIVNPRMMLIAEFAMLATIQQMHLKMCHRLAELLNVSPENHISDCRDVCNIFRRVRLADVSAIGDCERRLLKTINS